MFRGSPQGLTMEPRIVRDASGWRPKSKKTQQFFARLLHLDFVGLSALFVFD